MKTTGIDKHLGLAALALLILGCLAVLHPFLSALLWAAILVSVTWPTFIHIDRLLGKRRNLAALSMTLIVSVTVIAPFAIVAFGLADNAAQFIDATSDLLERGLPDAPDWLSRFPLIGESLRKYWQGLAHDSGRLSEELKQLLPSVQGFLLAAGTTIGTGLLQLTLSVFIAFFLFRDGEAIGRRGAGILLKVDGERGLRLMNIAHNTVTGVVYGILGTALAQGVLAGIGFAVAGVPGALVLGLATFFFSVIPVGPPLIWGGAAFWLFQQGEIGWTIFIVLWGFLVVSMVDNIIKPLIISRGSRLPFILVFLGVLGGVVTFGLIGVFLGPVLLAVGYRLLDEWSNSLIETKNEDTPPR